MRKNFGTDLRSARQDYFAWSPPPDRPLSARELELAADLEMAAGNSRRADMLSWKAHLARTKTAPTQQDVP